MCECKNPVLAELRKASISPQSSMCSVPFKNANQHSSKEDA